MARERLRRYAKGLSLKDVVFDDEIVNASNALQKAGNAASVAGIGAERPTTAALDRAAPVYRKAWWAKRDMPTGRASRSSRGSSRGVAGDAHRRHARVPGEMAGRGYPVRVGGLQQLAGASSTRGRLLVMASLDEGSSGPYELEIAFPAKPAPVGQPILHLQAAAKRAQVSRIPDSLSHAMIFYTAGKAAPARRAFACAICRTGRDVEAGPIRPVPRGVRISAGKPYLDGTGSLDAALDPLIKAVAP